MEEKILNKPNNVIAINTTLSDLFKHWFIFLRPFHHLTDRQIDVAAEFVKLRYELSSVISDEKLLDEVVLNESSKLKVRQKCNMTNAHFQVVVGELKKAGVIANNKINPRYIPRIKSTNSFQLLLLFNIKEDEGSN